MSEIAAQSVGWVSSGISRGRARVTNAMVKIRLPPKMRCFV